MKYVLSAFFWLYLVLSLMVFWFAVVGVWLVLLPFDRRRRFSHWYAWIWANHYVALSPFWKVNIVGRERIRDDQAYVLVANHQSFGDIFVLYGLRKHFKWVAKSSVFLVPFLGWMMWMAGYVGIRRGDPNSRETMMTRCRELLAKGSSVMMFPEGTRHGDGKVHKFRRGAFTLACEAKVPVVPIVIEGTINALPRGSWVFQHTGRLAIQVRVLEPVPFEAGGNDPELLGQRVHDIMQRELTDMQQGPKTQA
ncbi:MAG: lysophospholipid acyltransferase family protein [Nannocystaceae bacterium]